MKKPKRRWLQSMDVYDRRRRFVAQLGENERGKLGLVGANDRRLIRLFTELKLRRRQPPFEIPSSELQQVVRVLADEGYDVRLNEGDGRWR
jgi:hypothetical protein